MRLDGGLDGGWGGDCSCVIWWGKKVIALIE